MKRSFIVMLALAASAAAQAPTREAQQAAYQAWRETEPRLEMDAASAGTALEARAQKAAAAVAAFYAARNSPGASATDLAAFLERFTQVPEDSLASLSSLQRVLGPASQNVAALVATFAGDPDPAIQQLRQALERERTALDALNATIQLRQRTSDAAFAANGAVEDAASDALAAYSNVALVRAGLAEQLRKEAAAWPVYYERLAQGARGVTISSTNPSATAPGPAAGPAVASPKPFAPKPTVTPLPLSRYVGGWVFPPNGTYLGGQPEFVELTVREAGGHVTGTLYAKFVLPAGSPGDPFVRFDFEGDLQPKRDQQFTIRTSEGAGGTIQLIPGSVFNMIEVVFQTDRVENKVRGGNFILLKR